MAKAELNSTIRLAAGGGLSVPLLTLMMWLPRDLPSYLVMGGIGATAIVVLVPVIFRGDWVQRTLAVLVLLLPSIGLISAFFLVAGLL